MKKRIKQVVTVLVFLVAGCSSSPRDQVGFSIEDGKLFKGNSEFVIRAVDKENFLDSRPSFAQRRMTLHQLAAVGCNSIVITYPAGGASPEWLMSLEELIDNIRWVRMGLILKLPEGIGQPDQVVSTLAERFSEAWDVVFWFEGERGPELAEAFSGQTSGLLTAAAGGGDISVVSPGTGTGSGPELVLLPNAIPEEPANYILADIRENYDLLNRTYEGAREGEPSLPEGYTGLTDLEKQQGYLSLFNGKNFDGWVLTGDPSGWAVEDGMIVWKGRGGGYVRSSRRYDNFTLRLDWRIEEGGNSGLFVRAPLAGRASRIGMEFQLFGDYGEEPHKNGTGSIYDVVAPRINASRPIGEWNSVQLTCNGSFLEAELNGVIIHELDLNEIPELRVRLRNGFLALQDHGSPVWFRNIRIKPL